MTEQHLSFPDYEGDWSTARREWLELLGASGQLDQPDMPPFKPQTLKQVFTGVLALGKAAGRLGDTMALLGHQEASLRQLREDIGIPRAAPPESLPRVAVVVREGQEWWTPGQWVPDLIDRAAGRDVLCASGDPIATIHPDQLGEAELDHLFILISAGERDSHFDSVAHAAAHVHVIDRPERWLNPGPQLMHAIFEAASYLHGVSGVFSATPDHQRH